MVDSSRIVRLPAWAFHALIFLSGWMSPVAYIINAIMEVIS